MATPTYNVDYDDERFQQVEQDKSNALNDLEQTYSDMIGKSDDYYQQQIDAAEQWKDKQTELQNQQTQHTIDQINQQKDQAHKDYTKEQSGAYVDWQKQSNQYGAEAEKMASAGLANTGYSESSQVSMYNTYQNRVAAARESYSNAVLNYDNAIKDAQLQNSSVLAEIAYNALQQQLELSLQGFQYKNNLILEQASKKTELQNTYYNRYLDVLNQINTENAMAEDIRQFEETQKFNENQAQLDRDFQSAQAEIDRNFQAAQAELERKHDMALLEAQTAKEKELLEEQHKKDLEKLAQQHQNDLAILQKQYEYNKKLKGSSGSGGGGGGGGDTNTGVIRNDDPNSLESAKDYLDRIVSAGATKTEVSKEITSAVKAGVITEAEATKLRDIYLRRGLTY